VKPIAIDVVYRTPWFELVAKTMKPGEHPYYSIRISDYTVMIAVTGAGEILAVRQYRPALERFTIELPAGLCNPDEDPMDTARRELIEETGYDAAELANLGPITTDNGRIGNRMWVFFATGLRPVDGWQPEEGIEVIRYSMPDLIRAAAGGEFDHSLHMGALLAAAVQGKIKLGI
jgi:ADP-ribose pyrophosphatase